MIRAVPVLASLLAAVGAGCSSPLVATIAPDLATGPRSYFVRVAEALTSASMGEPMRVAPRLFSPYQIQEACERPRRVDRLEAPARRVELRVGERLELRTLRVVAVGDGNILVPDVPLVIEAEEQNPPLVQLRSDDPDLAEGQLLTLNAGTFRVRVRTLCSATNAEMTLTGVVTP
jgi:hypothetical protein